MIGFGNYRGSLHHAEDISDYKAVPGTQYGTNPGGVHTAPNGEKHYVKFYHNPEQAHAEVATARVYEKMGAGTLNPRLVTHNGKIGVASKWRDDLQDIPHHDYHNPSEGMKHELAKHFVAGAVTKNWDTVGLEFDNLKKTPEGKVVSVDQGGSLHFRAQGGPKNFTPDADEYHSYRDAGLNHASAHAFKTVTNDHLHKAFHEMKASHTDEDIHHIFKNSGLPNASHFSETLISRREALGHHISSALKPQA